MDHLALIKKGCFPFAGEIYELATPRSDRGFEGEEYFSLLEDQLYNDTNTKESTNPHIKKLNARINYYKKRAINED